MAAIIANQADQVAGILRHTRFVQSDMEHKSWYFLLVGGEVTRTAFYTKMGLAADFVEMYEWDGSAGIKKPNRINDAG